MKSKIILTGECKCGKTTLMNKVLNSAVASNKLTLTDVYGYKTIPVIENNDLTAFDIETFHGVRARIASINKISEFKFKRFYVNINSFNYVIQAELEAGEGIGRRHAKDERDHHGDGGEQHRVPQVAHEVELQAASRGAHLTRHQRDVVVECRREHHRRRDAQDRLVGLERHQEDPDDRKHEEDNDQRDEHAADDLFES